MSLVNHRRFFLSSRLHSLYWQTDDCPQIFTICLDPQQSATAFNKTFIVMGQGLQWHIKQIPNCTLHAAFHYTLHRNILDIQDIAIHILACVTPGCI